MRATYQPIIRIHPNIQRNHSVLIAGQVDSGKSSLASLLASYAVRLGRAPLFVDLDVGQGNIGVPGKEREKRTEMGWISITDDS